MKRNIAIIVFIIMIPLMTFGAQIKKIGENSIKYDSKSKPSYFNKKLFFIDGDKKIFAGLSGKGRNEYFFYYFDIPTFKRVSVEIPVPEYLKKNPELLIKSRLSQKRYKKDPLNLFDIEEFAFYNEELNLAGLTVKNKYRTTATEDERLYFLFWDLEKKEIKKAVPLYERSEKKVKGEKCKSYIYRRIGFGKDKKIFYFLLTESDGVRTSKYRRKMNKVRNNRVMAVSEEGIKEITSFKTSKRSLNNNLYFSAEAGIALAVENLSKGQRGYGYIINLKKSTIKKTLIPSTSYSAAINPNGKRIYIGSLDTGFIWEINALTARRIRRLWVGKWGWSLGYIKDGTLAYVRNSGIQLLTTGARLKKTTFISNKAIYGKEPSTTYRNGSIIGTGYCLTTSAKTVYLVQFD